MLNRTVRNALVAVAFLLATALHATLFAQFGARGPRVVSPEVSAEREVTFRVLAPKAEAVRLSGGDMPEIGQGVDMVKGDEGVWEAKVGPVDAGAYRYNFNVDGVTVIDPKNPATSESNNNSWSLVYVPGSEISDTLDVPHGAIAGLSMGGAQTLNIAVPHLEQFAYVGVFSSGVFELGGRGRRDDSGPSWEQQNEKSLSEPALKEGLELFWFATGRDDFLIETSRNSVAMLQKHGFDVVFQETAGGHTWINWRQYLHDFAQVLFKPGASKAIPATGTSGS